MHCRNPECTCPPPYETDGYCDEGCRAKVEGPQSTAEERGRLATWAAMLQEQVAGMDPAAAFRWYAEFAAEQEAIFAEAGICFLAVVHGRLERDQDQALGLRLMQAVADECDGRRWEPMYSPWRDRVIVAVGPPDADLAVARLAEIARGLAEEAAAGGGRRWQVAQVMNPRPQ
jgi:hypothetical protein